MVLVRVVLPLFLLGTRVTMSGTGSLSLGETRDNLGEGCRYRSQYHTMTKDIILTHETQSQQPLLHFDKNKRRSRTYLVFIFLK